MSVETADQERMRLAREKKVAELAAHFSFTRVIQERRFGQALLSVNVRVVTGMDEVALRQVMAESDRIFHEATLHGGGLGLSITIPRAAQTLLNSDLVEIDQDYLKQVRARLTGIDVSDL